LAAASQVAAAAAVLSQLLQAQESLRGNYQPVLHMHCQAVLRCCPTSCWGLQLLLLAAPAAAAAAVAAVGCLPCCLAGNQLLLLLLLLLVYVTGSCQTGLYSWRIPLSQTAFLLLLLLVLLAELCCCLLAPGMHQTGWSSSTMLSAQQRPHHCCQLLHLQHQHLHSLAELRCCCCQLLTCLAATAASPRYDQLQAQLQCLLAVQMYLVPKAQEACLTACLALLLVVGPQLLQQVPVAPCQVNLAAGCGCCCMAASC
jgi:hypothetical protein